MTISRPGDAPQRPLRMHPMDQEVARRYLQQTRDLQHRAHASADHVTATSSPR
uniref:Uncharacterized protein n=1 Tax=Arundo donax TaxID=35708 RepID=A0A0A9CL27_ARUDO